MDNRDTISPNDTFGFLKTNLDVHTLGIINASGFLRDCGIRVVMPSPEIEACVEHIKDEENQKKVCEWISKSNIDHIGFSFRLDPLEGERIFIEFYRFLRSNSLLKEQGGRIRKIAFSGLRETCMKIKEVFGDRIITFEGEETPEEFLIQIGVSIEALPKSLKSNTHYDEKRLSLANDWYKSGGYEGEKAPAHGGYPEFGTMKDTIEKRLDFIKKSLSTPVIRAHIGPYDDNRQAALQLYSEWVKELAKSGYLDVLSIGSSQLTQSHFEKDWTGLINGGGVPIRTREEYFRVLLDAKPMLVRSYAGTDRLEFMARIHEEYLNIAWHALSFWWFNRLDGRGPLTLEESLQQTFDAMEYIASTKKALEANVSHHFAFRGCDDLTYVVSAYLTAKAARKCGIKTFILQNMLNTPNLTWGINDIAKARALLVLTRSLEKPNFEIVYETRAGLSYFSPDLEKAKRQLMAVTMLMDDVEPSNSLSPEIIHVVGYSEAQYLATPSVVNDSIKMTLFALRKYRDFKTKETLLTEEENQFIINRTAQLVGEAKEYIETIESNIANTYSAQGFYQIFLQGYLPAPQLWAERDTFHKATQWDVKYLNGGFYVVDNEGKPMRIDERINRILR